ncbi:BnaA01g27910D [Brassica napus]|uniref:BnaA01g27910D protein n=1 Tax=Brassica napus TaxID=3708 RepID=A0A078IAK2_BRANA|nr:BnaA01g27910D [Brassica napus]
MLPWELEEEILYRLPPKSLSFINKHLSHSRPQFIFLTQSKIYSIDIIDQKIHLRELHSSCRELNSEYGTISTCDDLLFCKYPFLWKKETALWNPCSRQLNLIKLSVDRDFTVLGLGYDNSGPQKVHKILLYYPHPEEVAIYECASHVLRYINTLEEDMYICDMSNEAKGWPHVSLNGNLYWIAYNRQTCEYFIQSFNFSNEIFKPVCLLPPFEDDHSWNEHLLAVWKGDRFSLLQQCFLTRNIGIWVTKDKADDKKEVVWINLMTLTATNLPYLCNKMYGVSYFIYDKTLFMCCGDGSSQPCIHIVKGDRCNKIQIGYGEDGWFSHCAYVPNLDSVPLEFQIE